MPDNLEKLIKKVYKEWREAGLGRQEPHPDEESLALFLEGNLSGEENESVKKHLISCESCSEAFSVQVRLKEGREKQAPKELLEQLKGLVTEKREPLVLEVFLRLKEQALEVMNTTGDVLVGREFMPCAVLRSRNLKDFKDEVTILKDFKDIRVEVKIENRQGGYFKLSILAKEKRTQAIIKNLRFALFKDDIEFESYLNDSGKVTFDNLALGKYTVEITDVKDKLASVLLDIKT